jgi:hypothetical protein
MDEELVSNSFLGLTFSVSAFSIAQNIFPADKIMIWKKLV